MPVPITAATAFESPGNHSNHGRLSFDHNSTAGNNDDDVGDVEWNLGELVGDEEAFLNSLPDQEDDDEEEYEQGGGSSSTNAPPHGTHQHGAGSTSAAPHGSSTRAALSSSVSTGTVQSRISMSDATMNDSDSIATAASSISKSGAASTTGPLTNKQPLTKGPSRRAAGKKKKQKASGSSVKMGLPKRPLSSYNLFFAAERVRVYEHAAANDQRVSFEELGKLIGKRWRALSDQDRKIYDEQADKEVERYREERRKYEEARRERIRNGGRYDFSAIGLGHQQQDKPKSDVSAKAPPSASNFFPGSRGGAGVGPSHPLPPGTLVPSGRPDESYRAQAYDGAYGMDESGQSFQYGRRDAHGGDLMLPPLQPQHGHPFYPSSVAAAPPPQHLMRPPPPPHSFKQQQQHPVHFSSFRDDDNDEEPSDDEGNNPPSGRYYPAASTAMTHSSLPQYPPYSLPSHLAPPPLQNQHPDAMPDAGTEVTALDEHGNLVTYKIQYACYRMKRHEADEYMSQFQQYLAMNQHHHHPPQNHNHHHARRGGAAPGGGGGGGSTDPPSLSSSTSSSNGI